MPAPDADGPAVGSGGDLADQPVHGPPQRCPPIPVQVLQRGGQLGGGGPVRRPPGRDGTDQRAHAVQYPCGGGVEFPGGRRVQGERHLVGADHCQRSGPFDAAHHFGQGDLRGAEPGWRVRRGREALPQVIQRAAGGGVGRRVTVAFRVRPHQDSQLLRSPGQRRPADVERGAGPDQQQGGQAQQGRQRPASQPVGYLAGRHRHVHRQHVREQQVRAAERRRGAQHPGEQDHERGHPHRDHGQDVLVRAEAADDDERGGGDDQHRVTAQPAGPVATEVDQQQERERAEGGEQRHLDVAGESPGDREGRRDDHCCPHRSLEREQAGVVGPQEGHRMPAA